MPLGRTVRLEDEEPRRHPILRILFILLFLLLLVVAAAIFTAGIWLKHKMQDSLPEIDGNVLVHGLSASVTVRRDQHGVPHIQAANLDDLLFAQGYVTAQDRLWQMDMARRMAAGEAAEVLGSKLVDHDRMQRVLAIRATAERLTASLPPEQRRLFDDYAHGVNAYIGSHMDRLPAEFRLLMYQPKPWQPVDSMLVVMSMVQMLDEHWPDKLDRERITARLGPTLAAALYPTGSWRDRPPITTEPPITAPNQVIPDIPLDESQDGFSAARHDPAILRGAPHASNPAPASLASAPTNPGLAATTPSAPTNLASAPTNLASAATHPGLAATTPSAPTNLAAAATTPSAPTNLAAAA
ncbi:MAG: penicillin acylase family protein, partial [Acidobacteriota bacterium]